MGKLTRYACAFCGEAIEKRGPDPCDLWITTRYCSKRSKQREQGFSCHAACLAARMDPLAASVIEIFDVGDDPRA